MANWQRTLDLMPEWNMAKNNEMSTQSLALVVADRLSCLRPLGGNIEQERLDIIGEFVDLSKDDSADNDDFDLIFERLYDWADTPLDTNWNGKKVCWVKTS